MLAGTADARGFRQWEQVGRRVKKGAKALYILGPCKLKRTVVDARTGQEVERVVVVGFRAMPVFAIEAPEGGELERPDYRPAELPPLFAVAGRLSVCVPWLPFSDRFLGYFQPSRSQIVLATHDVETWFHELAHAAHQAVLRVRGASVKGGQDARQVDRGRDCRGYSAACTASSAASGTAPSTCAATPRERIPAAPP
jgi:hypothetical protein